MEKIKTYKCPCCSDNLEYSPGEETLVCRSCDNKFSLSDVEMLCDIDSETSSPSVFDWDSYTERSFDVTEVNLFDYNCPSCGANVSGDETMGACVCPYCGNTEIIRAQFEKTLRPDFIVPFELDKAAAIKAYENDFKNAPFLPDEFRNKNKIKEMTGVYVPYWIFDCKCNASVTYNAQKTVMWSDSSYNYVKTDYFRLLRKGSVEFLHIPVDGSKKADDSHTEAIEPFDFSKAREFDFSYLSGFLADRYDVSCDESVERANERVENSVADVFDDTTDRYNAVTTEKTGVSFSGGKIRYGLLPVWMLNVKYNGQNYHFSVNGQTGKVVGEYPIDKGKEKRYFAKVLAIGLAVAAAVAAFILL